MQASAESDVIRRLADDDPAALADAYHTHAGRCRAVAYRILRDDAAAADAVQEAYLSLWRHRAGLVVRSAGIGPWLVVATRNAALNMARTAMRRSARETMASSAASGDVEDPVAMALATIDAAEVRTAVGALPEDQRTVIALSYFKGETLAQIAARTGTPLGTVKRRAQLALARLARTLGTHGT